MQLEAGEPNAADGGEPHRRHHDPPTSAPGTRPNVTIVAHDFTFDLPRAVPSGYVDVTLENKGKQDHQIQLVQLGPTTYDAFKAAAITTDIGAVKPSAVFVGGPNDAAPGKSTTVTVKLDPGLYAVTCFIPGDRRQAARRRTE